MFQKPIIMVFCLFLLLHSIFADEPAKKKVLLAKTSITDPLLNRARAYLDKGKLKLAVENYGIFSGTASPQGLWGDFQYISNVSLVLGVPGKDKNGNPYPWAVGPKEQYNVKNQAFETYGDENTYWGPTVDESWMDRTDNLNRTDWEAVEDSRFRLHNPLATAGDYYGALGLYTDAEDQYPLIATSDIPDTWPLVTNASGEEVPTWPGPWAIDPADTSGSQILDGVFVSDQDIYFEFDDRLATRDIDPTQGYPLGIRVKVSGYSYGASISEDIMFFKMTLHNESQYHYQGVYAGFYFDADSYNRWADGNYAGRTNDDDMMGYNTDWDFGYIYDLDGESGPYFDWTKTELAYSAVKLLETPAASEDIDLDGDGSTDITEGDKLGLTSWHWFDWYFRPGARDVNPTQGPWSGDGETPFAENKEEIQYKILAGDTTNLSVYDSTHYFHPYRSEVGYGQLNPRFDSVEGLLYEKPEGLDCVFIMGSGPFDLAPGDSVPFSFCILMGKDENDLITNARIAQLMYDNNYQGARPPKAPNVIAREEDEKITLYWDDVSVHDKDIITGYEDFEGYRIYRSTDNGATWGDRYYDEESGTVYWKPYAQYDLDDDIEGYEKIMPHRYMGNNSGLVYKFEDNNVINGQEYIYAVCAYDRGFIPGDELLDPDNVAESKALNFEVASLENLLSNSPNLSHIVKVIPHKPPSNTRYTQLTVERKEGTIGNGIFNVEVINPTLLTGAEYEILFDCEYSDPPINNDIIPGSQTYTITNMDNGNTLIENSREWSKDLEEPESPPILDGLRWGIQMSTQITVNSEDIHWTPSSKCTYKLITYRLSNATRSNYEIRFIGEDAEDTYNFAGTAVNGKSPFQVWNTVTGKKAILVQPNGKEFAQKTNYFIREDGLPEAKYSDDNPLTNTLNIVFDWVGPDSFDVDGKLIPADIDWAPGDTLVIPVRKPFERGDGFIVKTDKAFEVVPVNKENLDSVRVVPNPYIVRAQWESDSYVRKLQFTNLPDNCKIHIFTLVGEKVITLQHNSSYDGSENWDMLSSNRQEIAPGLYVYVVEAANGKKKAGKFVVIK